MPITQATVNKLTYLFQQMKMQLKISDAYAKQNKPKTDLLPSVWEMQNTHLRDTLNECESLLERDSQV